MGKNKNKRRKHMAQIKLTKEQTREMMENKLRSVKHINRKKYNRKKEVKDYE